MSGLTIREALGLVDVRQGLVALTGGGGKSALLRALGDALAAQGARTVLTTTTRLFAAQAAGPEVLQIDPERPDGALAAVGQVLDRLGICLLVGPPVGDKVQGVGPDLPGRLLARGDVDFVVVEADGSRQMPVKVPVAHEPVVPPEASLVVVVLGIDGLERPYREVVHRLTALRRLLPVDGADVLTPVQAATLLTHAQGGLQGVPDGARVVVWLNKVETAVQRHLATETARRVLAEARIERVVIGAVASAEPVEMVAGRVTAVVLAAGEGSRMGRTKQLLPWGETTVLGQTLAHVQASLVTDVVVVTGHEAAAVGMVAQAAGVATVHNADYAAGEMLSSLQVAVAGLMGKETAVVVMLADQPLVQPETINQLVLAFWQGRGDIIAPEFEGRRGNPVLIGRRHFVELLALPRGAAPRELLRRHAADVVHLPVADVGVVVDLDDAAAYERWQPG